jgi:hypothetical protein
MGVHQEGDPRLARIREELDLAERHQARCMIRQP